MMGLNAVSAPRNSPGILYPAALVRDQAASIGDDLVVDPLRHPRSPGEGLMSVRCDPGGTMTDRSSRVAVPIVLMEGGPDEVDGSCGDTRNGAERRNSTGALCASRSSRASESCRSGSDHYRA